MALERDALWDMMVVTQVAREGSLSAAARKLQVTPSAVSRQLARIEERLHVKLVQRTSRACSLTDAGARYVERALAVLAEAEALEREIEASHEAVRGRLTISAPTMLGQHIVARAAAALVTRWPALQVELRLEDGFADLVREELDIAIRISDALGGDALRAQRLATLPVILCASPDYLARAGAPTQPAQLASHTCLQLEHAPGGTRWTLRRGEQVMSAEVHAPLRSNSLAALHTCALAGAGVAPLPAYAAEPALRAGALTHVLPGWQMPPQILWAVHAHGTSLPARVRAFIEALRAQLAPPEAPVQAPGEA